MKRLHECLAPGVTITYCAPGDATNSHYLHRQGDAMADITATVRHAKSKVYLRTTGGSLKRPTRKRPFMVATEDEAWHKRWRQEARAHTIVRLSEQDSLEVLEKKLAAARAELVIVRQKLQEVES